MRGILIFSIWILTLLSVAFLLWLKYTRQISQIPGYANSYWLAKKERRHSVRLKAELPVICNVIERTGSIHHIFSKNLSGEGICIQVPEILPEGSGLELKIDLLPHKPLLLKGEVIWVKESNRSSRGVKRFFDTGIKFVDVEVDEEKRLKDFLHAAFRKQTS